MEEKFDCIVVGAGPAGVSAAYRLAQAGLEVLVFERGEYPGSKNVMGGILFTTVLNQLIPNFWEEAPVERYVKTRRFVALSGDSSMGFEFSSEKYASPPYNNNFTVLRAKFDQWFAAKAEEAGAMIISSTVVDDLIFENGRIVGVKARREEGEVYANVVILADGVNSLLAKKAGLRKEQKPEDFVLAVKEVLFLPEEKLKERFNLEGNEGIAIEYFGEATKGLPGSGFIYTNKDSISVGVGATVSSFMKSKIKPSELIEEFKAHPHIKPLLRGTEIREYLAHLIPEGGFEKIPRLFGNGILVTGDAAGFVNTSLYHEGTNLAMASGIAAAEAVIYAKEKGDYSADILSVYQKHLEEGFVFKDLKKYSKVPKVIESHPQFFNKYPQVFCELMENFFTVDSTPKEERIKMLKEKFRRDIGILRFLGDLNAGRKAVL